MTPIQEIDKAFAKVFEVLSSLQTTHLAKQNTHKREAILNDLRVAQEDANAAKMWALKAVTE